MKRLRGNFHMLHYSTSWTERLSKLCVWEKKEESYFEEREQYEANLQQETGCSKMVHSKMVQSSGCRTVKPGRSATLLAYTTQRPRWLQIRNSLCLRLLLRKTCGYFLYSFTMSWAIHLEHNWPSPRWHHTMTIADTHSSETTWQEHSTTKKRTAINHFSEFERLLQ